MVLACACRTDAATPAPRDGGSTPAVAQASQVVAQWDGGRVTLPQIESMLADELRQMDIQYRVERYERLHAALDGMVQDAIVDAEVARRGLADREQLFQQEVDARLAEPTEDELRQAFESLVTQMPDAQFEAARPHLRRQLLNEQRQQRHEQFLRELADGAHLQLDLPFPEIPRIDVPVADHDPVLGPREAPLTIVQFGGFQCFYCKRVAGTLERIVEDYQPNVRLVVKDFPLSGHARAESAAVAAHCAGAQDRYFDMARVLLDNQGRLEDDHLLGYAGALALDLEVFSRCLRDQALPRSIEDDIHLGRELGVTSTPTFFFNGLMVTGAHPYDRFAALVEQELTRLRAR